MSHHLLELCDCNHVAHHVVHAGHAEKPPRVFTYSVFHPFFEQYLTIRRDAAGLLVAALAVVLAAVAAFTGSPRLASILALCLASMLLQLLGLMAVLRVQLNAISVVNLAMGVGIGLEFLSHVAHAFAVAPGSRYVAAPLAVARASSAVNLQVDRDASRLGYRIRLLAPCRPTPLLRAACPTNKQPLLRRAKRVQHALTQRGAAICAGILLTKLVGVAMLAFSRTAIFAVYYFRMYAALVAVGAAHGLVLLPVLLAIVGPRCPAPAPAAATGASTPEEEDAAAHPVR